MNKVMLIGNICTDIQLRYTQSNMAVATFNLALNRPKKQDGTQEADFPNIVVWGKQAENIDKYLKKGSKLALEGRIQTRNYEDQNGQKRYVTEVVADNVQFLDNKKDGQATDNNVLTTNTPLDPYREMGRQVSMDDYPSVDENNLPF